MSTRYYRTLILAFAHVTTAAAQQPDAVEIRPTALTSVQVTPYSTNTQRFWVVNTGTQANQYSIFANVCNPYELYCEWSNTFLGLIAPNDSVPFDVTYTASHAGSSGTVSFEARISTNQSIRAGKTLTVMARQEPHLEVNAFNPGTAEERDLCVTIAAATDAAYECGACESCTRCRPSARVARRERRRCCTTAGSPILSRSLLRRYRRARATPQT